MREIDFSSSYCSFMKAFSQALAVMNWRLFARLVLVGVREELREPRY